MAENRALIAEPVAMYTQTESLKDNDLSKNLVSGDFERQYRDGMMEKPARRRHMLSIIGLTVGVIIGVVVGVLACWVLVRSWVRDGEIARLRQEVDELSAEMILLAASVKSLNVKHADEFKGIDDTLYADVDINPSWTDELKTSVKQDDGSLTKLHGLTVEDDTTLSDDDDDEDMYDDDDDDDTESGDWYRDYDSRRRKDGTSSMVRLRPEDFTDTVLTAERSTLQELKRKLNENPENPDIGFPPLGESAESSDPPRNKRSVFPDVSAESVDHISAPKTVARSDERRKTKKFTPGVDAPVNKVALHTVTRTVRSDEESTGRGRPFIAAHFHGNTSHLNTETHAHYKGNGLVRVAHDKPHDVWYPSPWTMASPHPRPTLTRNGHVHVHHSGVYLVYVQIYYLDSHDIISWVLHRTNADIEGRQTLLQCAQSAHSPEPMDKPNSCFSAAALYLRQGDRLAVRNTGGDRHSLMQPEKSFIGLIKLADAEEPNDDF